METVLNLEEKPYKPLYIKMQEQGKIPVQIFITKELKNKFKQECKKYKIPMQQVYVELIDLYANNSQALQQAILKNQINKINNKE